MRRYPLGQLAGILVLTLLAALTFLGTFRASDVVAVVVGAAALPILLSLVWRVRDRPHLVWVTLSNAVLFVVLMGIVVFKDTVVGGVVPTGTTLAAIVDATRHGWADILSAMPPVPATPPSLFVPAALTWIAAFVAAELAFRTRRVFLVLLPATIVGLAGVLFSDHASGSWGLGAVAYVVVAAAVVAARTSGFATDPLPFDARAEQRARRPELEGDESRESLEAALFRHRLAMAVPFVVLIGLVAVPVARLLPFVRSESQVVLRDHYEIPLDEQARVNPMPLIAGSRASDQVRFRVRFDQRLARSALGGAPKMRTAVLDEFDGTQWTSSSEFVTTGGALPATDAVAVKARSVDQTVTAVDLDGPWLPMLAQPVRLGIGADAQAQVAARSGVVIVAKPAAEGLTYDVTSRVAEVDASDFQTAGLATNASARAATATIDQLPEHLAAVQAEVSKGAASQTQQLSRLLLFFRSDPRVNPDAPFSVDPEAPVGFALGNLDVFVDKDKGRKGRPEQFAATFATVARSMGFPARIVVGYELADVVEPETVVEVRAKDATAWPEVQLEGLGWVAFDPLPNSSDSGQLSAEERQLDAVVNGAVSESANNPEQPPGTNPNLQPLPVPDEDDGAGRRTQVLLVCIVAIVVLLALLFSPWFRKRRRRRRRRSAPDPAARAEGAWRETLDRLIEAGIDGHPDTLTTAQVAEVVHERFGEGAQETVSTMGVLVNQALHDREPPSAALADETWQLSDEFLGIVRNDQTRRERLLAALDRRPLVGSTSDR